MQSSIITVAGFGSGIRYHLFVCRSIFASGSIFYAELETG